MRKRIRKEIGGICMVAALMFAAVPFVTMADVGGSTETQTEERRYVAVETSYCNLYIPEEMENELTTYLIEARDVTTVIFRFEIEGEPVDLYSISFGTGAGTPVGCFTKGNTTVDITCKINSLGSWADGNNGVKQAQDSVFDVLEKLSEEDGFSDYKN